MSTTKRFSLKKLLCLLLVLPMFLSLTACAKTAQLDVEATCDVSGTYATVSSKQELDDAIGEQTGFDADGYRLTVKMEMGSGEQKMTFKVNAIMKENEMAMKVVMPNMTKVFQNPNAPLEITEMYSYYKDGYMYSVDEDYDSETGAVTYVKIKEQVSIEEAIGSQGPSSIMSYFNDTEGLLNLIEAQTGAVVSKDGNNYKIEIEHLAVEDQTVDNVVVYLNFDTDSKFVAMNIQFAMEQEVSEGQKMPVSANVTLSAFNGNIEYPNLNDYEEVA